MEFLCFVSVMNHQSPWQCVVTHSRSQLAFLPHNITTSIPKQCTHLLQIPPNNWMYRIFMYVYSCQTFLYILNF